MLRFLFVLQYKLTFFGFTTSNIDLRKKSSWSTENLKVLVSSKTFLNLIVVLPPTLISKGPCGLGYVPIPLMQNL